VRAAAVAGIALALAGCCRVASLGWARDRSARHWTEVRAPAVPGAASCQQRCGAPNLVTCHDTRVAQREPGSAPIAASERYVVCEYFDPGGGCASDVHE
jgi:hypothetical protein